ncbi:hypothetical protein BDV98DRAFT_598617 [Pterulicium gracile]|uniref:DUF6535 domain-containing protein n=1 Tax=Pterulicium gracile TaxID=1884261 RepID=A0A5C3PZV8_9AGAR|nr:hypothetical protein BDV98DRAFT_598617 [Pterula gracilis]
MATSTKYRSETPSSALNQDHFSHSASLEEQNDEEPEATGQAEAAGGETTGSALARLFECLVQDWTLVDEEGQNTLAGKAEKRVFALIKEKTTQQKIRPSLNPQHPTSGMGDRYDYETKYPLDKEGEGMSANARVWRVDLDESAHFDVDLVENIRDTVDGILAGLFSAVASTLVAQTSTALQPNFGQITAALLMEMIGPQHAMVAGTVVGTIPRSILNLSTPPIITGTDRCINAMWFISLAFGLSSALLSALVKQWIQAYVPPTFGTPHSQSRVRHFRYMGIKEWHVALITALLPILLHVALFLFSIGLVILLFTLDHVTAAFVTVIALLAYGT